MKKIWSMMLVALVAVGATSCTETDESVDKTEQSAGLSFYADISNDRTRAILEYDAEDKVWNTVWEGNETLVITDCSDDNYTEYRFTNSETEKNKFTCTDEEAVNLIGKSVTIYNDDEIYVTSRSGKKALFVYNYIEEFSVEKPIKLTSEISFLRYTYNGEGSVTFNVSFNNGDYDIYVFREPDADGEFSESVSEITFDGIKGENWVPVWPSVQSGNDHNATLSYSINGVKCKETTIKGFGYGKVYNLGTLADAEQEMAKIYFVPSDDWKQDGAWFVAHFFNATEGYADVTLTDTDGDGTYECSVPADMTSVLFCRMNPAYTEFGWNDETVTDRVWNQTGDTAVGGEDNYFYITGWDSGLWGDKDGYDVPEFSVGLIGLGGNWETDVDMTLEGDYYTLKGVTVIETDTFKIRISDDWTENYGIPSAEEVEAISIDENKKHFLVQDGKNMQVAAGTYDFYFKYDTKAFFALTGGKTPVDVDIFSVGLIGLDGNWETDIDMTLEGDYYTLKNVTISATDTFKIRISDDWTENYGIPSAEEVEAINIDENKKHFLVQDGKNMQVATGRYDFYFNYDTKTFFALTGGKTPADIVDPDTSASNIGIVGSFQGWDLTSPIALAPETNGWMVATDVELYKDDEFKIVKDNSWDTSYGNEGEVLVGEVGEVYTLTSKSGQNIKVNKNGLFNIYFNVNSMKFKYECVEEFTDLTVNITVDNKANWSPLYIYLEKDGTVLTPEKGALVSDNKYPISGDYIGSSLTYKFISGNKVSDVQSVTITKSGASVTLEETIIKMYVTLDTDNSKQWWGTTMKIHVWNTGTSFDTSWPGRNMSYEGNYTWSIIVPSELVGKTINYLVHNGQGWQSKDAKVTIKAEGNTITGSSIGIN